MLSLCRNGFLDGDDFRNDGWVYNQGKRTRKWFGNVFMHGTDMGRIWEPKYLDIPTLEAKRWKMVQRYRKWTQEVWMPVWDAVKQVGQAHAKVCHEYSGKCDPWWLYTFHDYGGISMDWVSEPAEPLNLEIGQRYYYVERDALQTMSTRKSLFDAAFYRAMEKMLWKEENKPKTIGQTLKVQINNRLYWYITIINRHGVLEWEFLARPEDAVADIIL